MSINIITQPTVRLVGRQSIDESALAEFLSDEDVEQWTTDTDIAGQKLVEVAGRLCYKSYAKPRPGGNAAYLGHILEVGHGSVIEHSVYNFIITGVSRSLTHELVRHRAGWAYSQRSQRFCDEADASFVKPPLISELEQHKDWGHLGSQWLKAVQNAQEAYSELSDELYRALTEIEYEAAGRPLMHEINDDPDCQFATEVREYLKRQPTERRTMFRKKSREAARSILPNATETQIFVTVNARALRHFLEARGDEHADAEIRAVALAMLDILKAESPNLFGDYEVVGGAIHTKYRKV